MKWFFKIHQVEAVIDKIIEKARTGEIGDGKIFCKCTALLVTSSSHATGFIFILVQDSCVTILFPFYLQHLITNCSLAWPRGPYCLVLMLAYNRNIRIFLLFYSFFFHLFYFQSEIEILISSCSFKLLVGFSILKYTNAVITGKVVAPELAA